METIPKTNCLEIGYLQKPHGIKGEVVLQFNPEFEASLDEESTLFLEIDGLLVPFYIREEGLRFRSAETALIHFDWVENEVEARKICGCAVYIHQDDWVNDEEELPIHMLIGYTLFDGQKGEIGPITQVDDYAGNLILTISFRGQELLIPFNEDFLLRFDEDKKEIELQCPEGIFDL